MNILLGAPHEGHLQFYGISSKAVPGAISDRGSPFSGSYMYPHTLHLYLAMITPFFINLDIPAFY